MAIIGPSQLPLVFKAESDPLKRIALHELGHPTTLVELTEDNFESAIRRVGDFITEYFPLEEKYAFFMTQPLQTEYPIPEDAYWIRDVFWDPATTRIDDIFGAESFLFNIGNISGIQNLLTDFHLLQAYRKFSQRVLGNEGTWEFSAETQRIRLIPVPKGSFPVVIRYLPIYTEFKKPSHREVFLRAFIAKCKQALGAARRRHGNIPSPDGGSLSLDGEALASEGKEEWDQVIEDAINLGEPLPIIIL